MKITDEILKQIMPNVPRVKRNVYLPFINEAMAEFEINTELRAAAFLAQLAHESGELRYMEEIASGSQYEGRKDLGNTEPGDGKRYKGRGPIQLTGRTNYQKYGQLLGLNLEGNPEVAATPEVGFRVAGQFWKLNGLNSLADKRQFKEITKRINGGYNGLADRVKYYDRAMIAIPDDFTEDNGAAVADETHPDFEPKELTILPTPVPNEAPKSTTEDRSEVTPIPAIAPLPVRISDKLKKYGKWAVGANVAGLGGPYVLKATGFIKNNPELMAALVGFFKWTAFGLATFGCIYIIRVTAKEMWNAHLANQLNIARLQNYGNKDTKNIDFQGWKGTVPVGIEEQPTEPKEETTK